MRAKLLAARIHAKGCVHRELTVPHDHHVDQEKLLLDVPSSAQLG